MFRVAELNKIPDPTAAQLWAIEVEQHFSSQVESGVIQKVLPEDLIALMPRRGSFESLGALGLILEIRTCIGEVVVKPLDDRGDL